MYSYPVGNNGYPVSILSNSLGMNFPRKCMVSPYEPI